jgi:hypothetical protein
MQTRVNISLLNISFYFPVNAIQTNNFRLYDTTLMLSECQYVKSSMPLNSASEN